MKQVAIFSSQTTIDFQRNLWSYGITTVRIPNPTGAPTSSTSAVLWGGLVLAANLSPQKGRTGKIMTPLHVRRSWRKEDRRTNAPTKTQGRNAESLFVRDLVSNKMKETSTGYSSVGKRRIKSTMKRRTRARIPSICFLAGQLLLRGLKKVTERTKKLRT